ncbi:MAG: hypothetical protein ACI9GZ_000967, partial [Bacteroidia bacterium]
MMNLSGKSIIAFLAVAWTFTIQAQITQITNVTTTSPVINESNIVASDDIIVIFDAALDGETLNSSNIQVRGGNSGLHSATFLGGGTSSLTINPDNDFLAGEKVTVTITNGVMGLSAEVAVPYALSFTIETAPFEGAFIKESTALEGVVDGAAAWADYDGDGDLDVVVSGWDFGYGLEITKIFNNSAGTFTDIGASLTGAYEGSTDWGDYDNDGDLDLFVTGFDGSGNPTAILYQNNAGTFSVVSGPFQGVAFSEADWGDFDNDGDLDLVVQGKYNATFPALTSTNLYRNDGVSFTMLTAGLVGVYKGDISWGDYDNDGDLDLVSSGSTDSDAPQLTTIYRNDAGVFIDISAGLEWKFVGSVNWGDYDNDNDLDLLVSGANTDPDNAPVIYRNDAGTFVDITAGLLANAEGESAWGDYDGDGDLDIVINGSGETNDPTTTIYTNNSGSFVDSGIRVDRYIYGTVDWGDYDNDGDLDLLLTGTDDFNGGRISLFSNSLAPPTIYNATNVTTTGFTPNLIAPSGAFDLIVDVSDDPAFGSFISQNVSVGTSGGVDINVSLAAGTQYYYRAKTDFGGTESTYYISNGFMVPPGNALPFTSNQYVEVFDNPLLAPSGDFTIEFWINTTATGNKIILEKGSTNVEYSVQQLSGDLIGINVNGGTMQTNNSYNDGTWHHVAIIYRGASDGTIYVDGIEDVNTGSIALGVPAYSLGRLTIGDRRFAEIFNIEGSIDEVRIWDDERLLSEIRANRFSTLVGDEQGLIAYFQFDEQAGSILPNLADNLLPDGELTNMSGNEWTSSSALTQTVNAFITTWTTSDTQITIPTNFGTYTYDFDVYWQNVIDPNDNGSLSAQTGDAVIIGLTNGAIYQVEITRNFPAIHFAGAGDVAKLLTIEQWGDIVWEDFTDAFNGCLNLIVTAADTPDLTLTTSLSAMFQDCAALTNEDFTGWDISTITDLNGTFKRATNFDGNVTNWNVAGVTDMLELFRQTSFNQDLSGWSVGSVTRTNHMFNGTPFDQAIGIWVFTTALTDMTGMFSGASVFNQNLGSWEIGGVTDMTGMLDNSGISTANYDATLTGWVTDNDLDGNIDQVPSTITLGAAGLTYSAIAARDELISTYSWTITGDGLPNVTEDFELHTGSNFESLASGDYHAASILIESTFFNSPTQAIRIDRLSDGVLVTPQMDGNTNFTFYYAIENAGESHFEISTSVDGAGYIVQATPTATNTAFAQYNLPLAAGVNSSVRVRIKMQGGISDQDLIVDDFEFGLYTGGITYPPVMDNLFANNPEPTTIDVDVTVDLYSDLYYVITLSATPPSPVQVEAGQDHTEAAAPNFGSNSGITGTWNAQMGIGNYGANDVALTPGLTYYVHFIAKETNNLANVSPTLTSASFTTPIPSDITVTTVDVPAENLVLGSTNNLIYKLKIDVLDADAGFGGMALFPIVTNVNDFTQFHFYESIDLDDFVNATLLESSTFLSAENTYGLPENYIAYIPVSTISYTAGTSVYLYVSVDVDVAATEANTISIDLPLFETNFAFDQPHTPTSIGLTASNTFTIQAPTQAEVISFSTITENSVEVTWANGTGTTGRIVAIKEIDFVSAGFPAAIDNTTYLANTNYGDGDVIASGWYVVGAGDIAAPLNVTGLNPGLEYTVAVLEYRGGSGSEIYLTNTSTDNPTSFFTNCDPIAITLSVTDNSSCLSGNGEIFIQASQSTAAEPTLGYTFELYDEVMNP